MADASRQSAQAGSFNALFREMLVANDAWGTNGVRCAQRMFFAGPGKPEVVLLETIARYRMANSSLRRGS
ncbi:MAG: hypothetical protein ACREV9_09865 [Burkholderiales bacterium]